MLEKAFDNYVSNYDLDDLNIKLKYNHSYRVMRLQEKYAKLLNFSDDDIELAKLIGLLHDIGRFEQLKVYNTYNDGLSVDHADYSVEQLFDKNQIENFTKRKDWYPIIKFAIQNHNKHLIEKVDDERVLMHAKLIRDTDKIDIIYLLGVLDELKSRATDEPIDLDVIESIKQHKTAKRKDNHTKNDKYAIQMAFTFDIYNDICLKEFKENFKVYYKRLNGEKIFKDIYTEIIKYIDERIEKYERNRN